MAGEAGFRGGPVARPARRHVAADDRTGDCAGRKLPATVRHRRPSDDAVRERGAGPRLLASRPGLRSRVRAARRALATQAHRRRGRWADARRHGGGALDAVARRRRRPRLATLGHARGRDRDFAAAGVALGDRPPRGATRPAAAVTRADPRGRRDGVRRRLAGCRDTRRAAGSRRHRLRAIATVVRRDAGRPGRAAGGVALQDGPRAGRRRAFRVPRPRRYADEAARRRNRQAPRFRRLSVEPARPRCLPDDARRPRMATGVKRLGREADGRLYRPERAYVR
jgi:hypothetical protein